MPRLARIRVHPIKALDAAEPDQMAVSPVGGLTDDRTLALVDEDGAYINGKRTDAVHRLQARYDLADGTVTLAERGGSETTFSLTADRSALAAWFADALGQPVRLESGEGGSLTDSRVLGGKQPGVTVISTATLEAVADWFPALDVEGLRRRFRANLEVDGVPAFWEDRLAAGGGQGFRVGAVSFQGEKPVPRCVVPTRDPDTGTETEGFRRRFIERRRETLPGWLDPEDLDGDYVLTVLARPKPAHRGREIAVGDEVTIDE